MSWYKIKINPADTLFSKIVRHGKETCQKCDKFRDLQCCHIVGRTAQATRYMLEPVKNAVALCSTCHKWFDSKTSKDILFNAALQQIKQPDNRWWWLVNHAGYTWEDLHYLCWISGRPMATSKTLHYQESLKNLKKIAGELCK